MTSSSSDTITATAISHPQQTNSTIPAVQLNVNIVDPQISTSSSTPATSPKHHNRLGPNVTNLTAVRDREGSKETFLEQKTNSNTISGFAGHVMLEYKSGGKLLTSAAHWIDLNHIDTKNTTGLLQVVQSMYGKEYAKEIQSELRSASFDKEMEMMILQRNAKQMIQSAVPCGYSIRRVATSYNNGLRSKSKSKSKSHSWKRKLSKTNNKVGPSPTDALSKLQSDN
jgi:hypothetical protein